MTEAGTATELGRGALSSFDGGDGTDCTQWPGSIPPAEVGEGSTGAEHMEAARESLAYVLTREIQRGPREAT